MYTLYAPNSFLESAYALTQTRLVLVGAGRGRVFVHWKGFQSRADQPGARRPRRPGEPPWPCRLAGTRKGAISRQAGAEPARPRTSTLQHQRRSLARATGGACRWQGPGRCRGSRPRPSTACSICSVRSNPLRVAPGPERAVSASRMERSH